MTELITNLVYQLGINKNKAENGVGALLKTIKQNTSYDIFKSLSSAIPGADDFLLGFEKQKEIEDDNLLVNFRQLGAGLITGQSEQITSLVSNFCKAGYSLEMVKQFLPITIDYLKRNSSAESVEKIYRQIPALNIILGRSKSSGLLGNFQKFFS